MRQSLTGMGWAVALLGAALAHAAQPGPAGANAEALATALVTQMTADEKLPQLLNVAPSIPRLGVPAYNWWTESLHGANGPLATTNFPEPIALAATFDAPLVGDVAAAIREELRALHGLARQTGHLGRIGTGLDTWSPNINIFRDPRWGRGQETYGEDPFLTATLGVAFIKGMQGPDPQRPLVIATPKHFAVHSGPESTRHVADVQVSAHDLEDTYLPAFRAAVVEAHANSIMCAYNSVNGEPACANNLLLQQLLTTAWGFKGYVVSDCDALRDISEGHHFESDEAAAVARALRTGVTNECNTQTLQDLATPVSRYKDAVARGLLSWDVIDAALVKLFAARYRTGDLPGFLASEPPESTENEILSASHTSLALQSAERSSVLLKNNGILPVRPGSRLLLIGPLADSTRVLRGNYSSPLTGPAVSVLDGLQGTLKDSTITYLPSPASVTDGDPVPVGELQTPEGAPGLRADYFNAKGPPPSRFASYAEMDQFGRGLTYETTPVVTRTEMQVAALSQSLSAVREYYRKTWRGYLVPKRSGHYRLALGATTGSLTLAGQTLATLQDVPWGTAPEYHVLDLQAGVRYPIDIEARGSPALDIQLLWKRVAAAPVTDLRPAARDMDAIIAVVGLTSDLEGEESKIELPGFSGGDRTTLRLPEDQQRLLEAADATGKPLIVVLMNGSMLDLAWVKSHAAAALEAWYPGQSGGLAIARILAGLVNPSGHLPITFYKDVSELPPFEDYSMKGRTYRYYRGAPVYPFGYGLSYTRFAYQHLKVQQAALADGPGVDLTVSVRNVGRYAGSDASQVYLRFPEAPGVPDIALRGFQRVTLGAGEEKTLRFRLSPRDLSSVSPEGVRRIVAGRYEVIVGSGLPGSGVATTRARLLLPPLEHLPL